MEFGVSFFFLEGGGVVGYWAGFSTGGWGPVFGVLDFEFGA